MAVNADKKHLWESDIARSVEFYNRWFIEYAPVVYRDTRVDVVKQVRETLKQTSNLTSLGPDILRKHPAVLSILRMTTAPPLARDRLIGLAGVSAGFVRALESGKKIPGDAGDSAVEGSLQKISELIVRLADRGIFTWLDKGRAPKAAEVTRAAGIIADRVVGAVADPIIRNAQERRQLAAIKQWLEQRGYRHIESGAGLSLSNMEPGTFSFRLNIPVALGTEGATVNIPVDIVIKPLGSAVEELPLLVEAKSAGDFTNTNKRRKEEAVKASQLRATHGDGVRFILFLCGYFDRGYLAYEAAEGIDWVWEHRIDDLAEFGL
jgi:hypothetical protein